MTETETFERVAELILSTCPSCHGQGEHRQGCKAAELALEPAHKQERPDLARQLKKAAQPNVELATRLLKAAEHHGRLAGAFEKAADELEDDDEADHYIDIADELDDTASRLRQWAEELNPTTKGEENG